MPGEGFKRIKMLRAMLSGLVTDKFVEMLLNGMDFAFNLDPLWPFKGYRRNLKDFNGRYVFTDRNGVVAASAIFQNDDMIVLTESANRWDVKVVFEDAQALSDFLLAGNQDIVDSLLNNKVEIEGNLNYIYKFGFMARDLGHRLGVA